MNLSNIRRFLCTAALGTAVALSPGTLRAANPDLAQNRIISPQLFDALGQWSEPQGGLLEVALDSYPETVEAYVPEVEALYRGVSLPSHFADHYPTAFAGYLEVTEAEPSDSNDFFAFVASSRETEFHKWQQEEAIVQSGLTFLDFVQRHFPHVVQAAEAATTTPAERGITFFEHLSSSGLDSLLGEADELFGGLITTDGDDCVCWTVVTFPHQPYGWQLEINDPYRRDWGFPKKKRHLDYTVRAQGAAKDIDLYRYTKHSLWEVDRIKSTNYSQLRVRMHCTEGGTPGGRHCEGATCSGDLSIRAEYGSRVYQRVDVGGAWSKRSRAIASDLAQLSYDVPGPAPTMTLFEKGVAVSGDTKTGWNSAAILQVLQSAAQVALIIAGDNTSAADFLDADLISDTFNGIIGLVTREGDPSSHQQDMYASFDNAGSAPFPLTPNVTHLFELDTTSRIYSRGYGGTSKGWGRVNSSHFLVAKTDNYQCSPGVTAPTPRAHWLWASGGAPHSATTLQNLVRDWIYTELGVWPSGTSQSIGQFPN